MALNLSLPATGGTKFGVLYAALRVNFDALNTSIINLTEDLSILQGFLEVEAWTDFTPGTGWSSSGGTWKQCSYMKDPFGFVHLKGLTLGSNTITYPNIYNNLPAAYRPEQDVSYTTVWTPGTGASLQVHISASTGIISATAGATNVTASLDGITFKAAV